VLDEGVVLVEGVLLGLRGGDGREDGEEEQEAGSQASYKKYLVTHSYHVC